MNYLLDKKNKRNKISKILLIVIVLFLVTFFWTGIFRGLSFAANTIFHPVLSFGQNVGGEISNIGSIFHNRRSLMLENEDLKSQILQSDADRANYASVVDENNKMKEILGRKPTMANMVLATILSKSSKSIYGTFLIDAGIDQGIIQGQKVFAWGSVPIGYIAEAYSGSSKVILYSNPGEKTEVIVTSKPIPPSLMGGDVYMQAVGRGGGNFEMILPRDFVLDVGSEAVLPGIMPRVLGTVSTIISDPRDSFQKALLASPVNIQELKFVEVEK